ncbi:uncharacterized protein OCT59_005003 [Rhizophagus irregularis]|nr:hypothetical protein OCT59_005003 [Rhizophagus irregularis]
MLSQDDVLCKHCDNFYTLRHWKWFEWISCNQLKDIKEICRDDFIVLYSAIWMDGPLKYDTYYKKECKRVPNKKVDLKYLYNSPNNINEFSNVAKLHTINDDKTMYLEDYIMILQEGYCKYCSKVYTHRF